MKVVCIDSVLINPLFPPLKDGEVYTVIDSLPNPSDNVLHYKLSEIPVRYYAHFHFIPLSSIDETTFERNYNKETV